MKSKIPQILIALRLLAGILLLVITFFEVMNLQLFSVILIVFGLLTDIFDGIIARRLNVSNEKLRRQDSTIDQIFFLLVIASCYIQNSIFFQTHFLKILILLVVEGSAYLICYFRFKKEIATHTIGAKFWTLLLVASLIQIVFLADSNILFACFFWMGIITRIEIISILLILKTWTTDVPSVYHAIRIRNGKEIKRNKLFNG